MANDENSMNKINTNAAISATVKTFGLVGGMAAAITLGVFYPEWSFGLIISGAVLFSSVTYWQLQYAKSKKRFPTNT